MWYRLLINAIVLVVFFTAAVIGVFIGSIIYKEGESLEVCWTNEGIAIYEENSEELGIEIEKDTCERFEKYSFQKEQIPITIALYNCEDPPQPLKDKAQIRDIESSIRSFNREGGFELFKLGALFSSNDDSAGAAYVNCAFRHEFRGQNYEFPKGRIQHYRSGGRIKFNMWIRADAASSSQVLRSIFIHELGHVVFLAHDKYPTSRMYYKIPEIAYDKNLQQHTFLSDTDRRLLITKYSE